MMKKQFLLVLALFVSVIQLVGAVWTVNTVPNTRLESNRIHVSDPDGYLSDSVEAVIDSALCSIRSKADVFVVTLTSIGEEVPKHFATELFNHWGIGSANTNNGVLLLFVEDQHALEFETGYGVEQTLTDAKCQQIFYKSIVPHFKEGDYEGGLCAGVAEILEVFGGDVPMAWKGDVETPGKDENVGFLPMLLGVIMLALPFWALWKWKSDKDKKNTLSMKEPMVTEEDGVTYINESSRQWSGSPWEGKGCLMASLYGLSLIACFFVAFMILYFLVNEANKPLLYNLSALLALFLYLTWICIRQNRRALKTADALAQVSVNPKSVYEAARNDKLTKATLTMAPWLSWVYKKKYASRIADSVDGRCPKCGKVMEPYEDFQLSDIHRDEEKLEVFKYMPFRCPDGHVTVLRRHGAMYHGYAKCAVCGAYTSKETESVTIKNATYSQDGERQTTYVCQHCGDVLVKSIVIPMLVHHTSSSSSSGSSGSHSGHSHSSGGSFGGGHSGGGGYSGRW